MPGTHATPAYVHGGGAIGAGSPKEFVCLGPTIRLHGTPIEVGDLFRLQKNRREAPAALFTHQLGWEVRLLVGSQLEVVQTQVWRDQEEVLATGNGGRPLSWRRGGGDVR